METNIRKKLGISVTILGAFIVLLAIPLMVEPIDWILVIVTIVAGFAISFWGRMIYFGKMSRNVEP